MGIGWGLFTWCQPLTAWRVGGSRFVSQHLWTESCAPSRTFRHTVSSCPKSHVWMSVGKAVVARLLGTWRRVIVRIVVGSAILGPCAFGNDCRIQLQSCQGDTLLSETRWIYSCSVPAFLCWFPEPGQQGRHAGLVAVYQSRQGSLVATSFGHNTWQLSKVVFQPSFEMRI